MNISYDKNTKQYILGDTPYTKEQFIAYIESDMLQAALATETGSFEIDGDDASDIADYGAANRIEGGANILLYGVPGSGKSWTIENEYCKPGSKVERLVFHPDYTYSDFVGQILPVVAEDGQVSYQFIPGPFTKILRDSIRNPESEYILIIEEINRGNAPAIFGEIFQLLDRKAEKKPTGDDGFPIGTSEYGISNINISKVIFGDPNREIRIPSNLSIIGTMNTSDQNVFTLDTAFQRRWEMRLIENSFDNVDPALADAKILDTTITWKNFCNVINGIIVGNSVRMSSSEDKRLGVHFVRLCDLKVDGESIVSNGRAYRKFPEKVIKYLWDDAFKFNREVVFETSKCQSLEQVIKLFMDSQGIERLGMFKDNVIQAMINPTV